MRNVDQYHRKVVIQFQVFGRRNAALPETPQHHFESITAVCLRKCNLHMSNETSRRPKPNIRTTGKWVLGGPFREATFGSNEKKKEKKKSRIQQTDAEGVVHKL